MRPLGIQPGPKTPEGVYARVVDGRTLYVNTTDEEKESRSERRRMEFFRTNRTRAK